MPMPKIAFVPLRAALPANQECTQDILIRIDPPPPAALPDRRRINLGLVIDRSGSMSGEKLSYARKAARFAVRQLLATDRVSITLFDDHVAVLQGPIEARDKEAIVRRIDGIRPGGSTALHDGWRQAASLVAAHREDGWINRVVLLSDGIANVGESNPDVIASAVHSALHKQGVATTAMGMGDDYNEDLLEAMARSGDGNYYYIASPEQLGEIFRVELHGLLATVGTGVTLSLAAGPGAVLQDVFNDLDRAPDGAFRLPNLVAGSPIVLAVRVKVGPDCAGPLLRATLSWTPAEAGAAAAEASEAPGGGTPSAPGAEAPGSGSVGPAISTLAAECTLPRVAPAQLAEFPFDPAVQARVAILLAARARAEAVESLDRGDYRRANQVLADARSLLSGTPASPEIDEEVARLRDLEQDLGEGTFDRARKKARYQTYSSRRSRPQ
ncbi:MAG: VWA domain-containing protein [Candidatus Sericytochromatia bacterium]|nr:VWA domain-containing protein [Candidatus Tanganyikabacteria bacterium]